METIETPLDPPLGWFQTENLHQDMNSHLILGRVVGHRCVSSNFAGQRPPKDDHIFEALGSSDELSSFVFLRVVKF